MIVRHILVISGVLLFLTGCVSQGFRDSVADFGEISSEAVKNHNTALNSVIAREDEKIRISLAKNGTILTYSKSCTELVFSGSAEDHFNCTITDGNGKPLKAAPRYRNIFALSNALSSYSENLALLATDASDDRTALTESLTGTVGSIGKLESAFRNLAKSENKESRISKFNPVATILGDLAGLYLDAKRQSALKQIIINSDPLVQETSILLSETSNLILQSERQNAFRKLNAESQQIRRLAARSSSPSEMRKAQDKYIDQFETFKAVSKSKDRFKNIGQAHSELSHAAQQGTSKADLKAAIEEILVLAKSVGELENELRVTDQSGD